MEQIVASIRKAIRGLSEAKNRRIEKAFVAEGTKCVLDALPHFDLRVLVATAEWYREHQDIVDLYSDRCLQATSADMERMSSLTTPQQVLAVLEIPEFFLDEYTLRDMRGRLVVALDRVQDPGNMGTILRICDWMGVRDILAGEDTVSIYNPKVVQATMGSIARVRVHYVNLVETIGKLKAYGMPVYGTFLAGSDIYKTSLTANGIIVMGNEGRGISDEVTALVDRRLYIPPYPGDAEHPESLNVAVATALTLAQFRHGKQ